MDDSLFNLVEQKLITKEEAYHRATDPKGMAARLAAIK
jgi:hypothetical protein